MFLLGGRYQVTRVDVIEHGAVGDGVHDDTDAVQATIDECAADGGGTVTIPAGEYVVRPLSLRDDIALHIDSGATLLASEAIHDYPVIDGRRTGVDDEREPTTAALVTGHDLENVSIVGRGTIDGRGQVWWDAKESGDLPEHGRPRTVNLYDCENVLIRDIDIRDSPSWNIHPLYCENLTIDNVSIDSPPESPNTDGINPESCRGVRVANCHITVGDDCVTIKSGANEQGRRVGLPCENVTVANCTMADGHGGVVIGSEMSGDVRDVTVTNCTLRGTDRGIRIKTQRGRGGVVENVRVSNIVMRRVACPFTINGYYFTDIDAEPVPLTEATPAVRNIHFSNITASEVESAGFFAGLPECHFGPISFSAVDIDATRSLDATDLDPVMADGYEQRHGLFCTSVSEITFDDVRVRTADGPAMTFERTDRVVVDTLRTPAAQEAPVIAAEAVEELLVSGCDIDDDVEPFLEVRGMGIDRLSLRGNHSALADRIDGAERADRLDTD